MYKSNLKINELLKSQIEKRKPSKNKINIIEYFLSKKEKDPSTVQFIKRSIQSSKPHKKSQSKSKNNKSVSGIEISTTLPTKQNSPHTQNQKCNNKTIKTKIYNHLKNKSLNCNNIVIKNQNLNSLKSNLFKNYNTKVQSTHNKSIIAKHRSITNKSNNISINVSENRKKSHMVSRSNSISNLEHSTTLTSSTTTTSKRITQKKEISQKPIAFSHKKNSHLKLKTNEAVKQLNTQFLHTEETNYNYQPNITEVNINQNNNYRSDMYITQNINKNNYINEYDLLSEDSVFNFSKHTSNNVTNNNSKEKNLKTISGNNDSGQNTISYTYSEDEGSSRKYIDKRRTKRNIDNKGGNNNIFIHNEDFLTFCEEMNQKLFAK